MDATPGRPAITQVPATSIGTFLITDIEGSTRLWEEHPGSMPATLAAHDGILRGAVEAGGGVVIKTMGDGFLVRFEEPAAAINVAIAAQRDLIGLSRQPGTEIRVRMALHSGTAQSRDGDYFGPALNRVSRLLALGHGGQVLLSGVTVTLAGGSIASDAELLDKGDHRLRDLDQPEHVFQLVATGLQRDFPPLRSIGWAQSNLPAQTTSFVARERELQEVRLILSEHRMVTLIGTGGTGKTRLMLEAASGADVLPRDGVWLTELAPLADPDLIPQEVGGALGVRNQPGTPVLEGLVDFLRHKELLLLLDNCEHVIGAAAALADRILTACPSVTMLASSREALGIAGEAVFQVPSLAVPATVERPHDHDPNFAEWFETVASSGAVRLFVDRAIAVQPTFMLTPQNAGPIVEICRRLDGIPLAIELAAARVTVLSVDEILKRLGDRFRLLTGGRRTAVPRQQTLQALIDWSWDLLPEVDRRLLRRLSVFAGGWTIEAAEAICADQTDEHVGTIDTLDALTGLIERSMVVVDRGLTSRYRLLETIRQYATERLVESGEGSTLRARHLAYFLDVALQSRLPVRGPQLVEWLAWLDAEADNLRAAVEWAIETDPEAAGRMCIALALMWRTHSPGASGVSWLGEAIESIRRLPAIDPGDPESIRARDMLLAQLLSEHAFAQATWMGVDARPIAEEAVTLARRLGDPPTLISALSSLMGVRFFAGSRDGIDELSREIIQLAESERDWWTLSMTEASLANSARFGEADALTPLLARAADHARLTGNPFVIGFVALTRARILGAAGKVSEARAAFVEAFTMYTELGDDRFVLVTRSDLGHMLRTAGELDEAEAIYRESLAGWEHLGNRGAIANQIEGFAFISVERGDEQRAATLLGAAARVRDAAGAQMMPWERETYDAAIGRVRAAMDAAAFEAAWAAGSRLDQEAAIALAIGGSV
jgi:predicted ATPase/class 3 adenylate cyclase